MANSTHMLREAGGVIGVSAPIPPAQQTTCGIRSPLGRLSAGWNFQN
jgi:hypothetical protein